MRALIVAIVVTGCGSPPAARLANTGGRPMPTISVRCYSGQRSYTRYPQKTSVVMRRTLDAETRTLTIERGMPGVIDVERWRIDPATGTMQRVAGRRSAERADGRLDGQPWDWHAWQIVIATGDLQTIERGELTADGGIAIVTGTPSEPRRSEERLAPRDCKSFERMRDMMQLY